MTEHFPRSLVFRTGLTLAAIVLLALVSIVASVVIADRMEGDAGAINMAGSLRMQAYHVAVLIDAPAPALDGAAADFERRLAAPVLLQTVAAARDPALADAFHDLNQRWQQDMRPLLRSMPVARDAYLAHIDAFVGDIDNFVRLLQYASEDKIRLLRVVQGLSMFLTLVLVFAAMYRLKADVITPLYALVGAARATGRGDFSVRVANDTEDELGVLGRAFNTMADDLSRQYGELEDRVTTKTAELKRNNEALDMLFRLSRLLAEPGNVQQRLPAAMDMLGETLGVCPAFVGDAMPGREHPGPRRAAVFPVAMHGRHYGQIVVETGDGTLDSWTEQVLRPAADLLSTALSLAEREQDQRRLLLMEERAVIARELHDSLAQSLSYLKIQVSRLDALMTRGADPREIREVLDALREGLNSAYRQLRELLTTFRLRLEGGQLDVALAAAAAEFSGRGLDVRLDYRLQHCPLAADEEIHVLQVVREALSNVARHAGATIAHVSLRQLGSGHVEIVVEDDGIGMRDPAGPKRQHHGLVIMRERAATLGGRIDWSAVEPRGTRVTLEFRPDHLSQEQPTP